ncbi:piggyBac transposable element-derived protein 4-like isoform X1 [Hemiscyllium ocellatum]|uniref:piggyBac transposable element-derived protein 4-like isoform X1 n=1 Tax=Hemiscyllium ocellatum TaxID=170820 RepID=UPI002966D06B|nr:piggyBac transposable element-derived protein 4-like isoform X1 [Hemiscyllium ocellatum]
MGSESDEDVFGDSVAQRQPSVNGSEAEGQHDGDWTEAVTKIQVPTFTERTGPQHQLASTADPLDYFTLLWPDSVFDTIAQETNRYAVQCQARDGKQDSSWIPTDSREIKAFLAINIMMGIKQLPRISLYWSQDTALRCPWIASAMSRDRFWKVNRYLHLRDNMGALEKSHPDHDPIFKVRTLMETVRSHFGQSYLPSCELSADEGMVAYKGRLYFKQYSPAKPTKWGLKVWMLCEAASGYCLNFDIYTGRRRMSSGHSLGHDVVTELCQPYLHRNHHIYFDRFFSSPALLQYLQLHDTRACSTIHLNRKGLPSVARKIQLTKQGATCFFQKGCLLLTIWKDKRQVATLSTNQSATMVESAGTLKPQAVVEYNKYMGGVDLSDQMRSYYPVGRPSKKWWRCVLWYLMNITIVNAWLIFKKSSHDPPLPSRYDHLNFRTSLAKLLRGDYSAGASRKGRLSSSSDTRYPVIFRNPSVHNLVKIQGRKKVCRQCSKYKRKTASGRSVETSFQCEFCETPLCRVSCFSNYHQSLP